MNRNHIALKKEEIRDQIRERRYCMNVGEYEEKSKAIAEKLLAMDEYLSSNRICCYVHKSITREVMTSEIMRNILDNLGKILIVPITRVSEHKLDLSIITCLDDLLPSTFGVPEPRNEMLVNPGIVDLFIIPCLAISERDGFRLGYGKAYYDILLSSIRQDIPVIALAFEFQVFPEVPASGHDKPASIIITEERIIRIHTQ